ncbi:MAG: D-alanyl-D-alanine carboxypeptidase [Desulfobacteraceae bacterium]|nr:D-alanyl-D-alanine carboxypeptidase [Desulfobacteraceae bacterium]
MKPKNTACVRPMSLTSWICWMLVLLLPAAAAAGPWQDVDQMIGPDDAAAVFAPDCRVMYAKNADQMQIPASTLKVLTALCAIERLGPDFRFETLFYRNDKNDLIIKGYGDPLLISEQVAEIAKILAGRIAQVRHLILDDTWADPEIDIPGTRTRSLQPYDAPAGALCVNFNTVAAERRNNTWVSAEPQTPLLPLAKKRLNQVRPKSGRILLSSANQDNLIYAGQLFAHFLGKHGLAPSGKIRAAKANPDAGQLVYRHKSAFALTAVVSQIMAYSNNFMTNQVLLALGAEQFGPPATLEKGVAVLSDFATQKLGISPQIVEGSGISRKNRISANMFGPVLCAFAPYHGLLTEENKIFYKTGTLNGIQTRVGFVFHKGELYGFAVLINTPKKPAVSVVNAIARCIRKN